MCALKIPKGIRQVNGAYRWETCINGVRKSGTCKTIQEAVTARKTAKGRSSNAILPAEQNFNQLSIKKANDVKDESPTLEQAIKAMRRADWSTAKSVTTIEINCQFLVEFFGAQRKLSTITTTDVDKYVVYLIEECRNKPPTVNRKLSVLSKILRRAYEKGSISKMPFIERQPESPGRVRFITPEEEEEILKLLKEWNRPRMHDTVIVLLDTGIRVGELLKLTAEEIRLDQGISGVIYLNETKNGTSRAVPLTTRAKGALLRLVKTCQEQGKVLHEQQTWITKNWNRLRNALGYSEDKFFVPHILRHTCCSRLVQRGAPLKKVQVWLGHKNIQTTLRYAHLCPDDLFDMTELLERDI